jgi:hypothetical protein
MDKASTDSFSKNTLDVWYLWQLKQSVFSYNILDGYGKGLSPMLRRWKILCLETMEDLEKKAEPWEETPAGLCSK